MKNEKYSHIMDIAFSFESDNESPFESSAQTIREAILKRLASLSDDELVNEAISNYETEEIV